MTLVLILVIWLLETGATITTNNIWVQIKEQAKSLMTEKDWKDLENTIDNLYVGFIPRLRYLREMSDFEFRVCLLIKIEIKISDIARLTTHSIESISSVRRRLYEKIHKKKGTPKEWDDFILSLWVFINAHIFAHWYKLEEIKFALFLCT